MAPFPPNDRNEDEFQHDKFLGLRNTVGSEGFELGDLEVANNCDIDDLSEIHRRYGTGAPTAGIDRCLWANDSICLGVGSNALKRLNADFSLTTLRSGLTPNRDLAYVSMGDRVFYSNGVETGIVQNGQNRTWGIEVPRLPVVAVTSGTLLAGDYQYVLTFVRNDGQESGAGRAGTIALSAVGGIALSSIPVSTDPSVVSVNVYATPVGGQTLYLRGTIPNGQTTFTINALQQDAFPLLTQFLSPPPAGDFLGLFNGRVLVGVGNRLYPSEPYAPELFDLRKSYAFLSRITMIDGVEHQLEGLWLGTEDIVARLDGKSPEEWTFDVVADYGVIPGTLTYNDGELLLDGSKKGDHVAFFATKRGLCAGTPKGEFFNLTEARYAYPSMDRGAGIVRRHRGIAQYLVSLEGIAVAGNVAA